MILNIKDGFTETFNSLIGPELANVMPVNFIFFFAISIFVLIIVLVIAVFVVPLFRKPGESLYRRYLELRDEMEQIDHDLANHKIIFEEYLKRQFVNAQEYRRIITILAEDPEYKSKIKSYVLKTNLDNNDSQNNVSREPRRLSREEIIQLQVKKLSNALYPKVTHFTKEDIYAILLFEGFNEIVVRSVLKDLILRGATFSTGKSTLEDRKDLSKFLGGLFEGNNDLESFKNTSESISFGKEEKKELFKDDFKSKSQISFDNVSELDKDYKTEKLKSEEKPGFFKKIFGKKEEPKPTVKDIDSIFKNIEKDILKKKDI